MNISQSASFRLSCLQEAAMLAKIHGWDKAKILEVAKSFFEFVTAPQ